RSYQRGDVVAVQLRDADLNTDSAQAETVAVLVTSNTEDTGAPAAITDLQANSGNVGTGTLSVSLTGDDVTAQSWEVLAISASEFLVTGTVSGQEASRLVTYDPGYITADGELSLSLSEGDVAFRAGDKFTFSTVAAEVTGESVTLTETDVDSGVFEATVSTNTDGSATAGNGVLDLTAGDRLRVIYTDNQGDWGGEEVVSANAFYATTVLSGRTLTADTVWTEDNSPYLIMGDVTVADGKSLTLMPGVEVLFLAGNDDTLGGEEAHKSELIVNGPLNISGREDAPVILRSSEAEGSRGDWGGVKVMSSGRLAVSYMQLQHSSYGVLLDNVSSYTSHSLVDSEISNSGQGIYVDDCYGCTITLERNSLSDITNYGVYGYSYYGSIFITATSITGGQGVSTRYASTVELVDSTFNDVNQVTLWNMRDTVRLSGNTFYLNGEVSIGSYSGTDLSTLLVENNTVTAESSSYSGLAITLGSSLITDSFNITGNTISGFGYNYYDYDSYIYDGYGLSVYSEKNVTPQISNNQIINNPGIGIYLSGKVLPQLTDNTITGNGAGVYVSYTDDGGDGSFTVSGNDISSNSGYGLTLGGNAQPVVQYNDLTGNGGYALSNQTGNAIDAKYNWWGTADTQEIESGGNPKNLTFILDAYDNSQYGMVNYSGYASATYSDTDGDGVNNDLDNCPTISNPDQADLDGDGFGNRCDIDVDGDGIANSNDRDNDNDGMFDRFERLYNLNHLDPSDADSDLDGDGLTNLEEALAGTRADQVDTDGDGVNDSEDGYPTDPTKTELPPEPAKNDVNGDGKSDLLWRSYDKGWNFLWTMDGTQTARVRPINVVASPSWDMVAQGDYDADGKSDIFWRNGNTGQNFIYLMDGESIKTRYTLNYVGAADWIVAGSGDFDGDGTYDVMWRNVNRGDTWFYLMDNGTIGTSLPSVWVTDLNYQVAATGDIDGDGDDDIIWRNIVTGSNHLWLMQDGQISDQRSLNTINSDWQIVGAGDLDGDGTDDIILRNQVSGDNWVYFMEAGQIRESTMISTVADTNWQIANIGDFDGDGKADFLWRHEANARNLIHLMDGTAVKSRGVLRNTDDTWKVAQ
ncbi:MAG: right-handed parallel beta-helix repeat-containing protein, partial [Pseudomonadota bacterium]|nr:right-handed parallel beta-helix repeat-containing protein [Pseudomonadota bacterium]